MEKKTTEYLETKIVKRIPEIDSTDKQKKENEENRRRRNQEKKREDQEKL